MQNAFMASLAAVCAMSFSLLESLRPSQEIYGGAATLWPEPGRCVVRRMISAWRS